jgi:catechol 2,3-dioxygenase-like lactoylglutathione lyase family enzyme
VTRPTVRAIHHVQLAMPSGREPEADAFYAAILGLRPIPKPPHLAARGGRWFGGDGFEVHLGIEEPFAPARKAHPAFVVSNIGAARASLRDAGCDVVEDTQLEGFERFYTSDPFGNRIELLAPLDRRG